MSADPNKKSPRTFQCRDGLWESFEQLARELECSADYLINEAMKQYIRQRAGARTPLPGANRAVEPSEASPLPSPGGVRSTGPQAVRAPLPPMRAPAPPRGAVPPPLPLPPPPVAPPAARAVPPPTAPQPGSRPPPAPPVPQARTVPPPIQPVARAPVPPPPPPTAVPASQAPAPAPQANGLSIVYQGERYPVTKERFIIGRGKQSSDLTLKDPNVSRQHAMVEYHSGVYFMVDMGSTNGVEFNGQRIARKQIGEGDTFRICDHEVTFTFR